MTQFILRKALKSYSFGQDKVINPSETIRNAMYALRNSKRPIFLKTEKIDHLDRLGIPVFISKIGAKQSWKGTNESYWGKGANVIQSKASAVMEAIERVSCTGFIRNENNYKVQGLSKINRSNVLKELVLSLPGIYRKNVSFIKDLKKSPLRYTSAFSLTENKNILFPLEWFSCTTNGFAAGNSIEEATLQGLCEVIERHAITTIVGKKVLTPEINIDSINNDIAKDMIMKFKNAGVTLYIKDFSLGLGIPTVAVIAHDQKTPHNGIIVNCAAGTSLNRDTALIRALTEVAQGRTQILYRTLGQIKEKQPIKIRFQSRFPTYKKPAKFLVISKRKIDFSEMPTYSNKDFKKEIEMAVVLLKKVGFRVIVTDVTHKDLKIPTVIVTIPRTIIIEDFDSNYSFTRHFYTHLILYYYRIKSYQNSIKACERYFKIDPKYSKYDIGVFHAYGANYAKLGNYKKAIDLLKRAASLCSKDDQKMLAAINKNLNKCYLKLSKSENHASLNYV